MADLVTLAEVRTYFEHDVDDTEHDAKYELLIPALTTAIRNFTERDFGTPVVTEMREFEYDGSGYIDIDDASDITSVSWKVPNADPILLDTDNWRPGPHRRDDAPVYLWIEVALWSGVYGSPELGFTRNLDTWVRERNWRSAPRDAIVAGTWGWPTIPEDVKLAAYWTIEDWMKKPSNEGLTAESIESYSRSWGTKQGLINLGIPVKARDLLAPYTKTLQA